MAINMDWRHLIYPPDLPNMLTVWFDCLRTGMSFLLFLVTWNVVEYCLS